MNRHHLCVFLCLLFLPFISACGGSSDTGSITAGYNVNENLAYVNPDSDTGVIQPHQTVVIKRAASEKNDDFYQELPYEIVSSGYYKFCVPDDDSHINRVELLDADGFELAEWRNGEACESAHLSPGEYTMRIHHASNDRDLFLFIKPHAVTKVNTVSRRAEKTAREALAYTASIPSSQFVDQEKSDLTAVVQYNADSGITEKWGLYGARYGGYIHFINPGAGPSYSPIGIGGSIPPEVIEKSGRLTASALVKFISDNGILVLDDKGNYLSTNSFVILQSGLPQYRMGMSNQSSLYTYCYMLSGRSSAKVFAIEMDGTNFSLKTGSNYIKYDAGYGIPAYITSGGDYYGYERTNETFTAVVRTGTVSGKTLPALATGDVALFDGCYGANGFDEGTVYWIINSSKTNFEDFSFDNPKGNIYTVMADRNVRAKLYSTENFQGNPQYVSPPMIVI